MRLLFILCVFLRGSGVVDRKHLALNPHYTGEWEYGDSAFLDASGVMYLVDNSSKGRGYAWNLRRFPSEKWSLSVTFTLDAGSKSSQIGFWFTKNSGQHGKAFGGPVQFSGLAALCYYNGTDFEIEIRENDGHGDFETFHFFPIFRSQPKSPTITLSFDYLSPTVTIAAFIDSEKKTVFQDRPRVRIRRCWFGITGQNSRHGSPIRVDAITMDIADDTRQSSSHLEVPQWRRLNESLANLKTALLKLDRGKIGVIDILDCFIEATEVGTGLANSGDVNELIMAKMLPLAESWQRRSISIIKDTKTLRGSLLVGLNATGRAIAMLKEDVDEAFKKLKNGMHDIESQLYFGVLNGNKLNHRLRSIKKDAKKSKVVRILLWSSVTEIGIVSSYLLFRFIMSKVSRKWQ
jgi:hypothetical protein